MQQMFLGLGAKVIEQTVSDGDTNVDASTLFGSDYADSVAKRLIIPAGVEIGATGSTSNRALTIPAGMGGTLEIKNLGTISGFGGTGGAKASGTPKGQTPATGSPGTAGGSAIYIAVNGVSVNNTGTIRGGGGGGDGGDAGDDGGLTTNGMFAVTSGSWSGYYCHPGGGGAGGDGGNGQGYNVAATNGQSGAGGAPRESGGTNWAAKGYQGSAIRAACDSQAAGDPNKNYFNGQSGEAGGNGGGFGQAGEGSGNESGTGGAAGKYIELASGISLSNTPSGTLQGTAP